MNLTECKIGEEYIVANVDTQDEELDAFLLSLGCYTGEPITVISSKKSNLIVAIKDARYSFDTALAKAITLQ